MAKNSSGDSHSTAVDSTFPTTSPTLDGSPPRASARTVWPSVPGSARNPTWVVKGTSRIATAADEAACSSSVRSASGECRNCCRLAISTSSFGIIEDGWADFHGDFLTIDQGLEAFTDAIKTIFD